MGTLLALVDGSVYSRSVCDNAAWIAGRTGSAVHLLHVLGRRETEGSQLNLSGNITLGARTALLEELAELDASRARLAQKRGRAILDDSRAILHEAGVAETGATLRTGDLVETVAELEPDYDMIVIGKRGEAADFASLHLGSNLERIARASRKPIFVAARAARPVRSVLIAFDGGTSSLKAVDHVSRDPLFQGLGCRLLMAGEANETNRRKLAGAEAMLKGAGYSVTSNLVPGHAETVISQIVESEGIDLLVMGAYGHSRIRSLVIGSTTSAMIRSCLIPVVLFR